MEQAMDAGAAIFVPHACIDMKLLIWQHIQQRIQSLLLVYLGQHACHLEDFVVIVVHHTLPSAHLQNKKTFLLLRSQKRRCYNFGATALPFLDIGIVPSHAA